MRYIIFTDGGSRGNPGEAAVGYVITTESGDVVAKGGESIGVTTNNEAEYQAPIRALQKLKSTIGKAKAKEAEVVLYADSELMVKQMNKQYKIENEKLQPLFLKLWNATIEFSSVTFSNVRRGENTEADRLVNEALDDSKDTGKLL